MVSIADLLKAVIRVSKKYLPGMSIGFQHPNVKVHIGDGFQFLKERKNEFDVIITDSSDPEGPAESLFQKPYFELLRDALRDGGVITTQGCSSPFLSVICPLSLFPLLTSPHLSLFYLSDSNPHIYLRYLYLCLYLYLFLWKRRR